VTLQELAQNAAAARILFPSDRGEDALALLLEVLGADIDVVSGIP